MRLSGLLRSSTAWLWWVGIGLLGLGGCAEPPAMEVDALARALLVADSLVDAAVPSEIPGAVLLIAQGGQVLHEQAYGYARLYDAEGSRLEAPRPMTAETLFDLASVTKVMATTYAAMLLVDRGALDLDATVSRYLPDFTGGHRDSITVRHLLNHSSGLVQWQPLYYQADEPGEVYRVIRGMPPGWAVGEGRHYSDLGFMLLGYIVEAASGQPLGAFLEAELYEPLGLSTLTFTPKAHGFERFAATETGNAYERRMVYDSTFGYRVPGDPEAWDGWRTDVLDGEVNDGNAWYGHGGMAGHAGLFGTAADLAVLLQVLNDGGVYGGQRLLREETIEAFLVRDGYGHYLGWRFPDGLPEGSFAHSGFTGTYVFGVPAHDLAVVLLTNRQHAGPDNRGAFFDLGPLTEAVARTLVEGAAAGRAAP